MFFINIKQLYSSGSVLSIVFLFCPDGDDDVQVYVGLD